jgi:nucleotidyltransferase substrate binding protein (TIGR01987 family)
MPTKTTYTNWQKRFSGYKKAFALLSKIVKIEELSNIQQLGLIKAFDLTFDLSWNTIKDYFLYQGITEIHDSRDAFRTAFKQGLIEDGETWMSMIESRTQTNQTYDESVASGIAGDIINNYYDRFKELENKLEKLAQYKR